MSKPLKPKRLIEFIDRMLSRRPQGVIDAAEIHIEYYDYRHDVRHVVPAVGMRIEATEHGPVKIIISEGVNV